MKKQNTEKTNYKGQKLSLGIDVHTNTWQVELLSKHLHLTSFSFPADPEKLAHKLFKQYPGAEIESCYEAGCFGYWIHRGLIKFGIKNKIVSPLDIPRQNKELDFKTDKIDAKKLGKYLRAGLLEGIHIIAESQEQDRNLLRQRKFLVRDQTRIKNRIKALLKFSGKNAPQGLNTNWTKAYLEWLNTIEWSESSGKTVLTNYLEQLKSLKNQLKKINRQIVILSRSEKYCEDVRLLRSIKGVGIYSSMVFITELSPITRFCNEKKLRAYVGLVPRSKDSGDKVRTGNITKRGNKFVKQILIECAWRAVKTDPKLTVYYEQLRGRMNANKAIVRVGTKLLNAIRAMLIKKEEYII